VAMGIPSETCAWTRVATRKLSLIPEEDASA
jgi:hypothetical protein